MRVCICLLLMLLSGAAHGQSWQWTSKARHHQAAVSVQSPPSGRSVNVTCGTLIQWGQLRGVLTCAHGLASPTAKVTFSDGRSVIGRCTKSRDGADVGFIYVDHPGLPHVPVSRNPPRYGDPAEFVTLGGPKPTSAAHTSRLRHFRATAGKTTARMQNWRTWVVSGDSGGGILSARRELVGVQSVGMGQSIRRDWPCYDGAGSATHKQTCLFLNRIIRAQMAAAGGGSPAGSGFYPPNRIGGGLINIASPRVIDFRQGSPGDDGDLGDFRPGGIGNVPQTAADDCPDCPVCPPTEPPATIQPVPPANGQAGIFALAPITVSGSVKLMSGSQLVREYQLTPVK